MHDDIAVRVLDVDIDDQVTRGAFGEVFRRRFTHQIGFALEARDISNPTVAEMRERDGSHVHF